MRKRHLISIISLVLLLPGASLADEFDRRGLYASVHGVYGVDLFSSQIASAIGIPNAVIDIGNSGGLNARVGYRALSWFALEVEYEWLKGIDLGFAGATVGTYKPHTLTANAKFFIPVWRVQPYLLAGGGVSIWEVQAASPIAGSGTGFGFRGGAGVDLYITKNWVLNAEGTAVLNTSQFEVALTPVFDKLYYFSLSAGLTYRF